MGDFPCAENVDRKDKARVGLDREKSVAERQRGITCVRVQHFDFHTPHTRPRRPPTHTFICRITKTYPKEHRAFVALVVLAVELLTEAWHGADSKM